MKSSEAAPPAESIPDQSSDIYVDEEGDWFNEGSPLFRDDIVRFFMQHVEELPDGRYIIVWGDRRCEFKAADTPFVVSRVDAIRGEGPEPERILLTLRHIPEPEVLDPRTLVSAPDNVLYCRVRQGRVRARFSRPAYYQLAQWIEEDPATGGFFLAVDGRRFAIHMEE